MKARRINLLTMLDYKTIFENRGDSYNRAHQLAPLARAEELSALLKWLRPQVGETILVTAAGGGFDAEGILKSVPYPGCRVICAEPSKEFASMIPKNLEVLHCPLDCIPMKSGTVDAVVNLAAMHHSASPEDEIREWVRLLKPHGRLVLADVEDDSNPGRFLNEAVDRYNPSGHQGRFLIPGSTTTLLKQDGPWKFIQEHAEHYHWRFCSEFEMTEFTRNLFGMSQASDKQITDSISHYLGYSSKDLGGAISYPWSLRFVFAQK
jgi:SAM-dependent methyltransferase